MAKRDRDEDANVRLRIVGKTLQAWRQKAGLTQMNVAESLSYSSSQFVSNWERGMSLPPLDAFPMLTKLFGVSPQEFIEVVSAYQLEILRLNKTRMARIFKTARK